MLPTSLCCLLVATVAQSGPPVPHIEDVLALPTVERFSLPEWVWKAAASGEAVTIPGVALGNGLEVELVLGPTSAVAPDAVLEVMSVDAAGRLASHTRPLAEAAPIVALAGRVAGDPHSHAFIGRGGEMTVGVVRAFGRQWIVSSGAAGAGLPAISFEPSAMPSELWPSVDAPCEVREIPAGADGGSSNDGGIAGASCRQMRVAVETDVEFLRDRFGGDTIAATSYVALLYTAMNEIYMRDVQVHPWLGYLRLWETADETVDPYSLEVGDRLGQFRDHWNGYMASVARHEAHILCGIGGGGVAWIPAVCSSYSYAASCVGGSFPYPLVHNNGGNWDLMVVAHEMGHNCGGPHTHQSDPVIDGCGSDPQDCTAADLDIGTIMSYCHICSGGMTNIRLEFAPGTITYIDNYISSLSCGLNGSEAAPVAVNDNAVLLQGTGPVDIDVLANDELVNCDAFSLGSYQTGTVNGGQISLGAGSTPQHPILRYTPAPSFSGEDAFAYTVQEVGSGLSSSGTVFVTVAPPMPPTAPVGDIAGFAASYYSGSWSVLPDFSQLTPVLQTWVSLLGYQSTGGNFANSGMADNVGAVYTGWLNVPQTGWWTLSTESDDGSKLWIDGDLVVANDGLHGMVKKAGTRPLAAGKHALRVEFFEAGGGAGLIMRWQGPGSGTGGDGSEAIIPSSRLTRGGAPLVGDVNADASVDGQDLAILLGNWGGAGVGDLDGSGSVGGGDLAMLLGGWTG